MKEIIIPKQEPKHIPYKGKVWEPPKQETLEEVECNNCGYLMSLTEDESVYACYNSECTSCYEEYEEEPKQETLEEAAENYNDDFQIKSGSKAPHIKNQHIMNHFIAGVKYQAERMYSEEELLQALNIGFTSTDETWEECIAFAKEQFKKK